MYCSHAFSVAGPICWNSVLPGYLKSPDLLFDCFKHQLQTSVLCIPGRTVLLQRIRDFRRYALQM